MNLVLNKRIIRERALALISKPHPSPLLVFGNQKSGTSVIAGLLASATGQRLVTDFAGAQEPFIGQLIRGQTSVETFVTRNAWTFSAPIVKEPSLTFVASQLMDYFGSKRAVMTMRDPWQNIRSILERLGVRGDLAAFAPGKKRINRTWQSIVAGSDLGTGPGHYIDILAKRWLRAAQIAEQLGDRLIIVRYEDFSKDKSGTIKALAETMALPIVADISSVVNRQFQPRGAGADPKMFFEPNYDRITAICGPKAAMLGYPA